MNIVITGATKGIGRELALKLASSGENKVLATGRSQDLLDSLASQSPRIHCLSADLAEAERSAGVIAAYVKDKFGRADILVNMAGALVLKDFQDFDPAEARRLMDVNFFGPAAVIRALKPFMGSGSHIVNISSMGGYQGSSKYRGLSYYSASKAALANLTECLASEFEGSGISVNCLALGAVATEMLQTAFPGYRAPVSAQKMAEFIADFSIKGHRYFNGKIIPVALSNP